MADMIVLGFVIDIIKVDKMVKIVMWFIVDIIIIDIKKCLLCTLIGKYVFFYQA